MTHAADILTEAFDFAVEELDGFVARLTAADPVLELERESVKHWTVTNVTRDLILYRSPDRNACVRFAQAFCRKTDGARLGLSFGLLSPSVSRSGDPMTPLDTVSAAVELLTSQAPVPQAVDGEPASLAGPGVSVAAHAAPPDSFSRRVPSNVIPIGGRP